MTSCRGCFDCGACQVSSISISRTTVSMARRQISEMLSFAPYVGMASKLFRCQPMLDIGIVGAIGFRRATHRLRVILASTA